MSKKKPLVLDVRLNRALKAASAEVKTWPWWKVSADVREQLKKLQKVRSR